MLCLDNKKRKMMLKKAKKMHGTTKRWVTYKALNEKHLKVNRANIFSVIFTKSQCRTLPNWIGLISSSNTDLLVSLDSITSTPN